jgi:glycosyltransferase involved in cell wall biosynthesis
MAGGDLRRDREELLGSRTAILCTLFPVPGGVLTMTSAMAALLEEGGYRSELAYYTPYQVTRALSVPIWKMAHRSPRREETERARGFVCHEIGVRLPEVESMRYRPTREWEEALSRGAVHLAVTGSALPAAPVVFSGRPCLAWVATPYYEDKTERLRELPPLRRLFDSVIDTPLSLRLERRVLERAKILALSRHTQRGLLGIAPSARIAPMPFPIATDLFHPDGDSVVRGRIGFSGRFDDPRKNIGLLLRAFAAAIPSVADLSLTIVGAVPTPKTVQMVADLGLAGRVELLGVVPREELVDFYRSLDVFVVPSAQEGLGIVALEAMACGCPVVSTRCGGPEDFVHPGENGFLVGFSEVEMADAIVRIVVDRGLRERLSGGAVETVRRDFSAEKVKQSFWSAFEETFGSTGGRSR